MKERLYSTAELGRLLSVSEATVKRWADTGRIGCFKTPGGHRKFRLCDISGFVEDTGYEVTGTLGALLYDGQIDRDCEQALSRRDLQSLGDRFERLAVAGDVSGLHGVFSCLLTRGVCLASIIDEVVSPAFTAIGEAWLAGTLTTVDEHVATRATMEALDRLGDSASPRVERDHVALSACLEGEQHDLAARAVTVVLRGCGYHAVHVGADTPVADLETHLRGHPTAILAISSKTPPDISDLDAQMKGLVRTAENSGTRLIVGGPGFSLLPGSTRRKLTVLGSCRDLVAAVGN